MLDRSPDPDTMAPGPALGASPVGPPIPFSTRPASSSNGTAGSSTTTGLSGTTQRYDDGTAVTEATESLAAKRGDGLDGTLQAIWRRVQLGDEEWISQQNYSYLGRRLPPAILLLNQPGLPPDVPAGLQPTERREVTATQFGKGDSEDEGTGSPLMGLVQTNSDVAGASVKASAMARVFGNGWQHDPRRLGALAEIFVRATGRVARVPLVDIGPGEHAPSNAEIDLTLAVDRFLGTQGKATVEYRILVPAT